MGWTVGGSVDQIGTGFWQAAEGTQSLDLNGSGPGSITQLVTDLVVGTNYWITFAMSGNPDQNPPSLKQMLVSMGGQSQSYSFDAAAATYADMGWVYEHLSFLADATEMTLTFQSQNDSNGGIALDDVGIAPVPVPASGLLLFGGILGFLALKRRRI